MNDAKLILISGPIAVGKSTVGKLLNSEHGFEAIKTGSLLKARAEASGISPTRYNLQELGDQLDLETDFKWVVDAAREYMSSNSERWIFDSVRKHRQVHHFRNGYSSEVRHVHFFADEETLRARYDARISAGRDYGNAPLYREAINHPNEIEARSLIQVADITIDIGLLTAEEAAQRILKAM